MSKTWNEQKNTSLVYGYLPSDEMQKQVKDAGKGWTLMGNYMGSDRCFCQVPLRRVTLTNSNPIRRWRKKEA